MAHWGGHAVRLRDPSGIPVHVVYGVPDLPALPGRAPLPLNFGSKPTRVNATQRPAGGRRRSSDWGTWCWAPPGSVRRWTGTWTRSG